MGLRILGLAWLTTVIAATPALAASPPASGPYGTWVRPDDGTTFTFFKCGGENGLCVRVKGVRDPADAKLIGTMVFSDASRIAENAWQGQVYNSEDGQKYLGKITLTGPGSLTLEGCVMGGAICKGETWTRIR